MGEDAVRCLRRRPIRAGETICDTLAATASYVRGEDVDSNRCLRRRPMRAGKTRIDVIRFPRRQVPVSTTIASRSEVSHDLHGSIGSGAPRPTTFVGSEGGSHRRGLGIVGNTISSIGIKILMVCLEIFFYDGTSYAERDIKEFSVRPDTICF